MFAAIGTLKGPYQTRYEVRWDDGELSGDEALVRLLTDHADDLEGQTVGPGDGPFTTTDHLASPISTIELIYDLMADPLFVGDVPRRCPLEDALQFP